MQPLSRTLSNGLTVIFVPMTNSSLVGISMHSLGGARVERKNVAGVAHYLEHILFRGGEKYPSQQIVNKAIEETGGEANAYTGQETIVCFIHAFKEHTRFMMELLADLWLAPRFSEEDINNERGPILREFAEREDDIDEKVRGSFDALLWGKHPLATSIIGTQKTISRITASDCRLYHKQFFCPANNVLCIAGALDENQVFEWAEQYFGRSVPENYKVILDNRALIQRPEVRARCSYQQSEQAQCMLGLAPIDWISFGPESSRKDRIAFSVLASILGCGMSSRLFSRVRSDKGLVYSIQAASMVHQDASSMLVAFSSDAKHVASVLDLIFEEFSILLKDGIRPEELGKIKNNQRRAFAESLENSLHSSLEYAHMALRGLSLVNFEEIYTSVIEPLTTDDIMELAEKVLKKEHWHAAITGPLHGYAKNIKQAMLV